MGDDRPIAYREMQGNGEEWSIFRSSGVGVCPTALVGAIQGRRGYYEEWQRKILDPAAERGNEAEPIVLNLLRARGYRIVEGSSQYEFMLNVMPRVWIRGHLDGQAYKPRGRKLHNVEVKSMSAARFARWKQYGGGDNGASYALQTDEFRPYAWQVSTQMLGASATHEGKVAGWLPSLYVVIDAGETGEWGEIKNDPDELDRRLDISELVAPPIEWSVIRRRVLWAEGWRKKYPAFPECEGADKSFCAYPMFHPDHADYIGDTDHIGGRDDDADPFGGIAREPDYEQPVVLDVTGARLAGMAEKWWGLTSQIEAGRKAEKDRKELNPQILELIGGTDKNAEWEDSHWRIKSRAGGTAGRVDMTALYRRLEEGGLIDPSKLGFGEFTRIWDELTPRYKYRNPHIERKEA